MRGDERMSRQLINESVLVLNKYFMAIQVTIVKEAICALTTGKAKVVDQDYVTYNLRQWEDFTSLYKLSEKANDYHGMMRSPSVQILAPQVIIIPDCEFNNPLIKTIRYSRRNVYQRDNFTCQYCHKKVDKANLTLDHVIPRSRGGKSRWENVVASCIWCNAKKGDKLLSELGWKLNKPPAPPRWKSHVGLPFNKEKKEYWNNFLR